MKMISTIGISLGLSTLANAANLALGGDYAYTTFVPEFTPGSNTYSDSTRTHASYTALGDFGSGELNNGTIYTVNANPAIINEGNYVSWETSNASTIDATIVFDLGALSDITSIRLDAYVYTPFANGVSTKYTVSYSNDNVTYSSSSTVTTGWTYVTGLKDHTEAVTQTAQYVKFEFAEADANGGNKYGLSEISIEGTVAVPEPSSAALLGLGGLALILRRRK